MEAINPFASLDSWSADRWSDGLQIQELDELDAVTVRTRHSVYELIVLAGDAGHVLVRGGHYFPEFTPARLMGSSGCGTFLKRLGIYRGLQLEFLVNRRRIVTSPVESVQITPSGLPG
jgi:hypothetical protein